ncbi:hypothetical protein HN836_02180 [Candidatus Woesearchaeota archaeon]|nr:hypothetical protein [Candidatus Woesearchaeota archaeon]
MKKIITSLILCSVLIGQKTIIIKTSSRSDLEFKGRIATGDKSEGTGSFVSINGDTTRIWKGGFKAGYFNGSGKYQHIVGIDSDSSWSGENFTYINGKKEGDFNRKLAYGGNLIFTYKNDKKIEVKKFTSNGTLDYKSYYEEGLPIKVEEFRENGSIERVHKWIGESKIKSKHYWPNGSISIESYTHENNYNFIGLMTKYDKDGVKAKEIIYDDDGSGNIISQKDFSAPSRSRSYDSSSDIDLSIFYILGGLALIFSIIYFNQSKVRGLKFKVTIKDGKYDYVDLSSNEPKTIEAHGMMKKITLNAKKLHFEPMINLLLFLLIIPVAFGFILTPWLGGIIAVIGFFILVFPFLSLRKKAQKSFIEYDLDENAQNRYKSIVKYFELIEQSCDFGNFSINKAAFIADNKSGFSGLLFHKSKDDYLSSNINYISFCLGKGALFLPDLIYFSINLFDHEWHCSSSDYDKFNVKFRKVSKHTEYLLDDHEQTGQTWRHPRKNGKPDKRFKDNPPVYIVNEGRLTFKNIYDDISSVKIAKNFTDKFNKLPKISKITQTKEKLTLDQLPNAPFKTIQENIYYLLISMTLADSNQDATTEELTLSIGIVKIFKDEGNLDNVFPLIAKDSKFEDIIYSDNLLGAIAFLAKNLDESKQFLLKGLIAKIASVDGIVDDGEKQILEYLNLYFSNDEINLKPIYKDDMYVDLILHLSIINDPFISDKVFSPDNYFFNKVTLNKKSGEKLISLQKEYLDLISDKNISQNEVINFFVKKYYSILYIDKMINDKDRKKVIEMLDGFILYFKSDETNSEHAFDYAEHYKMIKYLLI